MTTPETYLGAARAERFTNAMLSPGSHDFSAPPALPANEFAYRGAGGSRSTRRPPKPAPRSTSTSAPGASTWCSARRAEPRRLRVLLDGQPIAAADAGSDVHGGVVTVTGAPPLQPRRPAQVGQHVLTLEPEAGVEGYAFTFG